MIARVEFDTFPPEDIRQAWCAWLRHHTIDPHDVSVPGFIELDTDAYRISYLSYDLNEHGRRYYDPSVDDAARIIRTVQLEARPSQFPQQCVTSP